MEADAEKIASSGKFSSFALLDLETCNLPSHNHNRTAITELCIFGFAAKIANKSLSTEAKLKTDKAPPVPSTPRVLHKLALLLNPMMMIHPESERITGLNNYILEDESKFDENAANTVIGFLQHLQQPVCLVAHNGWSFDFPIVKQLFEKLGKNLPKELVCVDSLRAFLEIDTQRNMCATNEVLNSEVPLTLPTKLTEELIFTTNPSEVLLKDPKEVDSSVDEFTSLEDALSENSQFNWRAFNESTPKRAVNSVLRHVVKRKLIEEQIVQNATPIKEESFTPIKKFKSRRSLHFDGNASPLIKKYPPRGVYKLQNMYERIFKKIPVNAHHAEDDVEMLMKLLLHYGDDFMSYAEQHAKPLSEVPKLGHY